MSDRRKVLLINAVQQRRLIMGGVLLSVLLVNSLAIFALFVHPQLLELIEIPQTLALAGLEIIIVAVIGYFSLILSHRIAGPAYAIARDLKRFAGGDLTVRTRLRKGDFHTEVAEAFNLSGETFCTKIKSLKSSLSQLQQQENLDATTRSALDAVVRDMGYFKTEPPPSAKHTHSKAQENSAGAAVAVIGMDKPYSKR